jgi:hypothetical protein
VGDLAGRYDVLWTHHALPEGISLTNTQLHNHIPGMSVRPLPAHRNVSNVRAGQEFCDGGAPSQASRVAQVLCQKAQFGLFAHEMRFEFVPRYYTSSAR